MGALPCSEHRPIISFFLGLLTARPGPDQVPGLSSGQACQSALGAFGTSSFQGNTWYGRRHEEQLGCGLLAPVLRPALPEFAAHSSYHQLLCLAPGFLCRTRGPSLGLSSYAFQSCPAGAGRDQPRMWWEAGAHLVFACIAHGCFICSP